MSKFLLVVFSILSFSVVNAQIKVDKIDKLELEKIIKERNGKVLLLNIWATWCIPCREEFPDLVKIASEFAIHEVEVIGISIDYPEETESKIIPFLKKQKANFKNYVSAFKNDEQLIDFINKDWNGALPASIIYGKDGSMIKFMEGKKTYKDFAEIIKSQLN